MSTITKEWMYQKIAEMEFARDEIPFGLDEDDSKTLAALRIALASLEAEPVAYIRDGFRADGVHFCGGIISSEEHERTKPALSERYNWKHQPLFTAPPVPVSVPDENGLLPCPFCGSPAEHYPDGDMEGYSVMCGHKNGDCNS